MSDQQQEEEEEEGSMDGPQQVEVEREEDGMGVRVTNLLDGFFTKFRRGSLSNHSNASTSSSHQHQNTNTSLHGNNSTSTSTSKRPSTSALLRRNSSTASITKRVKFKEEQQQQQQQQQQLADSSSSIILRHGSNRSSMADESELSYSARSMDASANSHASWGVDMYEGPTGPGDVAILDSNNNKKTNTNKQLGSFLNRDNLDGSYWEHPQDSDNNDNLGPKWFEQYMPSFVVQIRAFCGMIVLDDRFQIIMILLILANAITMGIATFDFVYFNEQVQNKFEIVDQAFLIVFTMELALQFGYWGYQLFFDGWLLFDFITIIMSWWLDGVQVFRSFRIFRSFRLVVRIPILKSLVYAVFHVLPRISSIMMLFALITYIYAVMCTTLFKDLYKNGITSADYFGRLDYSLFTLFQFVTLENWGEIAREVGELHYYAYGLFGSFLTITGFILYSLVVAVVCDSFLMVESKIRKEIKEQAKRDRQRRRSTMKAKRKKRHGSSLSEVQDETSMRDDSGIKMEDDSERPTDEPTPKKKKENYKAAPPPASEECSSTGKNKGSSPQSAPAQKISLATIPAKEAVSPMPAPDEDSNLFSDEGNPTEDYTDRLPDPLTTTLATSPDTLTTTATTTLASGGLEQKLRHRRKKLVPSKQRIQCVQERLDTLANKQYEILETLGSLCSQVERYNARKNEDKEAIEEVNAGHTDVKSASRNTSSRSADAINASIDAVRSDIEDGVILLNQVRGRDGDGPWNELEKAAESDDEDAKFKKIKVKMPHNL